MATIGMPESVRVGNQAYLDEDYTAAIQAYGEAIASISDDAGDSEAEAVVRSNRAAAFLKAKKFREALQDASVAAKIAPSEIALYRKGLAAFALEEYETAVDAFRQARQRREASGVPPPQAGDTANDPRRYNMWVRKCEAEMEAEDVSAEKSREAKIDSSSAPAAPSAAQRAVPPVRAPVSSAPTHLRVRFQYYQSYEKITVAVLERNLKAGEVDVAVKARRLTVRRREGGALLFDKVLFEEVLPDKCKTRYLPSKLEVTLTKKTPSDWPELESTGAVISTGEDPPQAPAAATETTTTATDSTDTAVASKPVAEPPTKIARPYSTHKDWDVVDKEIQKELEADKPEGEEALNHLFKQIYGKADEDTRRAMVKSFQTSGGTVLSTNWDEVGKADYEKERQAPKGMEWRTWEGQKLPQKDDDDN